MTKAAIFDFDVLRVSSHRYTGQEYRRITVPCRVTPTRIYTSGSAYDRKTGVRIESRAVTRASTILVRVEPETLRKRA